MYSIQSGDTLTKIASKNRVSIEDILHSNPQIINPNILKAGQKIKIPANSSTTNHALKAHGPKNSIYEILRQGSAMFTSKFYLAYKFTLSMACTIFSCKSFDRKRFYNAYRHEFGKHTLHQKHVNGLNTLLDFIEHDPTITNVKVMAYMLATIHHETYWPRTNDRYVPICEHGTVSYFDKYDPVLGSSLVERQNAIDHGNTSKGDGYKYRGRGYVQITWKQNYKVFSKIVGHDLVKNPDLALKPEIAYKIISYGMLNGTFTGKKITAYIDSVKADYINARRVINRLDKASLIAGYAQKFERILAQSIEK